ncbi:MAG: hypothetical protein FRX49_10731 [Trebouxia sp. A1-2]|nr:MAG: hypothetical protein FRX49_10731 [Trebouxia sp. A1-2]
MIWLHTLRGSLVEDVWKLEEVMGCTFRKAPMAPRNPSCLKNRAAISPSKESIRCLSVHKDEGPEDEEEQDGKAANTKQRTPSSEYHTHPQYWMPPDEEAPKQDPRQPIPLGIQVLPMSQQADKKKKNKRRQGCEY